MTSHVLNLSRRNFLGTSGVLVLGTTLRPAFASQDSSSFNPNLFLTIHPNNTVEIISHRSEMGQGIRTAVAQVVADELDANWDNVVVGQALGDVRYGDQNTDGSKSIRTNLDRLREAGASARQMLLDAAAQTWNTDSAFLTTDDGYVHDHTNGRMASYGELSSIAAKLPAPKQVALKKRKDFKLIGASVVHVDAVDIAKGEGRYGADVRLPNMAVAVVKRAPTMGQTVEHIEVSDEIRNDRRFIGVEIIEPTPGAPLFFPVGGVAVMATDTYSALSLSEKIDIGWSGAATETFDSEELQADLRALVSNPSPLIHESGSVDSVFQSSTSVVERTYETAFLSHAPMEPPVALADVQGDVVNVWAPVQDPQNTQAQIAGWLKVSPEKIRVNVTLLGGAFGRKSKPDFVLEAVELSKRLKRPVRVQWSRENDIQYDYFHAPSAQLYKASIGSDGKPSAWLQRAAFPSIGTTFSAEASAPADWELDMGFTKTPYLFANQRFEADGVRAGVRIGWLRSVCNIFHAFGANVFVDELALEVGMDPIDYRLSIWPKSGLVNDPGMPSPHGHEFDYGRLRNVLTLVREFSDWNSARREGRSLGVAVHHSFYSYVATVVEVGTGVDANKVKNAWVVLDCGTYVNADTCIAQMEGAVIFGLSLAQKSKISIKHGKVEQDNFDSYELLRINEAPTVSVHLVDSTAEPAGVGEPGVPPVAPALSNALFLSTGVRHRNLPIS